MDNLLFDHIGDCEFGDECPIINALNIGLQFSIIIEDYDLYHHLEHYHIQLHNVIRRLSIISSLGLSIQPEVKTPNNHFVS